MTTQLSAQDFLDLFDRLTPADYLAPMKTGSGAGYEYLRALARLGERLSLSVVRFEACSFVGSAPSASLATATVALERGSAVAGEIVVKAGSILTTSRGDRWFQVAQDATFTANGSPQDLRAKTAAGSDEVPVAAAQPGYEWNVPGPKTAADGTILPGEIDSFHLLALADADGAPAFDPTIVVRQLTDAAGGAPPALDQLGADLGLPRSPGEGDAAYRARLRRLPDTVTPNAIFRAAAARLAPFLGPGDTFDVVETFDPAFQTAFDMSSTAPGTDVFVYDDPRPAWPPFANRWLDDETYRAAFVVVVPTLFPLLDVGGCRDDSALDAADCASPIGGRRALLCFDMAPDTDPTIVQGFYDGGDQPGEAVYAGLFDLLEAIVAGGVFFTLERQGQ